MITVYAYDENTKELLGTTQAQESPLESGVILMPKDSTATEPPAVGENQAAVWNGTSWSVVADLRGTVYYDADGTEHAHKTLGDLPYGALLQKPVIPEAVTVQSYDDALQKHLRDNRIARGYTVREPSDFKDSAVPRWAQDALDWIAFRDSCMLYGFGVQNTYARDGVAPSLEEFRADLPQIIWTYQDV